MLSDVTEEMLARIVESVFDTMMGVEVSPSKAEWRPDKDRMTASVGFSGEWNGVLLFECNRSQACQFVGHLLAIDPPADFDDSVRDALGELANMIGGNLKFSLGQGLNLSLPSIIDGDAHDSWAHEVEQSLAFTCPAGLFWVTLFTSTEQPLTDVVEQLSPQPMG